MSDCELDSAVKSALEALEESGLPKPQVLALIATGAGLLPTRLKSAVRVPLAKIDGVPDAWKDITLIGGTIDGTTFWLLDDAPGAQDEGGHARPGEPGWVRAFPVWLAASAGAAVCVHGSAGVALAEGDAPRIAPGSLVCVKDHVNMSGRTPLTALGASKLGPLFPDTTRLHHVELRQSALKRARILGVPTFEGIAACVPGPALETPAERRFWARAGADVAVQNLQDPLLASAHAGLATLAIVCVTDAGEGSTDVAGLLGHAEKLAPALEDLIAGIARELGAVAREQGVEEA